jgi:hypothetical protein
MILLAKGSRYIAKKIGMCISDKNVFHRFNSLLPFIFIKFTTVHDKRVYIKLYNFLYGFEHVVTNRFLALLQLGLKN